jgi:hypothetical protein
MVIRNFFVDSELNAQLNNSRKVVENLLYHQLAQTAFDANPGADAVWPVKMR